MRTTTFVFALLLLTGAEAGLAADYYFYGQPAPVYYPQPQPVVYFGQPAPISPYAAAVLYYGSVPMSSYTYPVAATFGYGAPFGYPIVAGYWPRPIYYAAPVTPPGMYGAPLRVNPEGRQSTMRIR